MIEGIEPSKIAEPASAGEVAQLMRAAHHEDASVVVAGGMQHQGIGNPPSEIGMLLRTTRLTSVEHYDAGDLTVGVGAGMTLAELQAMLANKQQFLPLEAAEPEKVTVGGLLAAAAHGPMKSGYGGVRDYCIGVRFVTAEGHAVKGGGRVVKNVAGYDLMKLLIGSYGTLGVITSASFKVFPRPRQRRTMVMEFAGLKEAMAFRDRMVASWLWSGCMCFEIASPNAHQYLRPPRTARDPDEFHASVATGLPWQVHLRVAGSDAVLARYARELGADAAVQHEGEEDADHWRGFARFEETLAAEHRNVMVMSVSVPMASVGATLAAMEETATDHNLLPAAIGRAAAGPLVMGFIPLSVDPPSAMQYANAASALRGKLPKDGSAVVVRCPREAKTYFDVWGSTPTDIEMMRRIKQAMDPKGLLAPGRFMV